MADTTTSASLSDDQIDQLLKDAELRLLAKQQGEISNAVTVPSKSDIVKAPKSEATKLKATTSASVKDNTKSEELSVRIPEARRSKKEMVRGASITYNLGILLLALAFYDEINIPIN